MNLGEGIKRVYAVFTALVMAGTAVGQSANPPSKQTLGWQFEDALKGSLVEESNRRTGQNAQVFNVDFGPKKGPDFLDSVCTGNPFTSYANANAQNTCKRYLEAVESLPESRLKYFLFAGMSTLGVGIVMWLIWLVLAWVGRGFTAKRA